MLTVQYELAKFDHAERLRQTEQNHLVQGLMANQPTGYARLLNKLGDLFITFGTNLKAQQPQELVEA